MTEVVEASNAEKLLSKNQKEELDHLSSRLDSITTEFKQTSHELDVSKDKLVAFEKDNVRVLFTFLISFICYLLSDGLI